MIDVGHPFSRPFQSLVESLQDSLLLGVEQPGTVELLFRSGTAAYPLAGAGPVSGLAPQASGFVKGKPAVFDLGRHYTYAVGQLVWQAPDAADPDAAEGWFPDDNSRLTVGYFWRGLPSGLTDFNAGSVAGTLVRAVARELKLLYEQMDQAYRRAFIDHAQGVALDNVVALLGVARNPALPAQGHVTFWCKRPPKADVTIAVGTRVADARGRIFRVTAAGTIAAGAASPKVTVPVVAQDTGPEGNLGSASLTVMPTPPRGVDGGVSNELPLTGGEDAEGDDALRERARHALESAGKSTLNAIRFAVLSVDGVDSVEVRDFSVDPAIAPGEIRVRYATGKPEVVGPQVLQAVESTRAAGIRARVSMVSTVTLSGRFLVIPDTAGATRQAFERYKQEVVDALRALGIGEAVSARKLAALAFKVPGLADVGEVQLLRRGPEDPAPVPVVADPLLVDADAQARPDPGAIQVLPLQALSVSAAQLGAGGTLTCTVKLLDDGGAALKLLGLKLALMAAVRGRPSATPNQPLQQVAQTSGSVQFAGTDGAAATFAPLAIPNLDALDAATLELQVQAAAYPGIRAATAPLAQA
ncbi:baseplate J/gp47 family protein [Azohydromonas aeria]|uniref:baseplate J/gp47 family protein n=1 Tax=Azohydromonas aeria TaxID=2590212 RepID=UPI0012FC89B0|nr:baseplate J/gp47 family protein [Azohydromonas aeria]